MVIFGIVGGIIALFALVSLLDMTKKEFKEVKSNFIVTRNNPIKKKIKTHNPLIGDVILYDFKRDSQGNINEEDVLYALYMLTIIGNGKNGGHFEYGFDETSGEFYAGLTEISDAHMLDLFTATTNVMFNSIQFKNKNTSLISFSEEGNPLTNEIKSHVMELIEETFYKYVEHLQEIMASEE